MHPVEVETVLETLTLIVDTREQPNERFKWRMKQIGLPFVRQKLDYGDYSARVILPDDTFFSFENIVVIERKMSLDELCQCYTKSRDRFAREFQRAQADGAKTYLLVEGGSWEYVIDGKYRSRMNPKALLASLTAWLARYNCQIIFCQQSTSGKMIRELLYREVKEYLEDTG